MTQETLQLINILLTGGVLLALIGAAVRYGQLTQKVDTHDDAIRNLWKSHEKTNERIDVIVNHK